MDVLLAGATGSGCDCVGAISQGPVVDRRRPSSQDGPHLNIILTSALVHSAQASRWAAPTCMETWPGKPASSREGLARCSYHISHVLHDSSRMASASGT